MAIISCYCDVLIYIWVNYNISLNSHKSPLITLLITICYILSSYLDMNISLDHPCPTSNGPSEPQILDNNHRDVKHWKMLWQSQWIRQKLSTNGFMIGLLLGLMFGCLCLAWVCSKWLWTLLNPLMTNNRLYVSLDDVIVLL